MRLVAPLLIAPIKNVLGAGIMIPQLEIASFIRKSVKDVSQMLMEMVKRESLPKLKYITCISILLFMDIALKHLAVNKLDANTYLEFIPFISFYLTTNSGIAFSLLDLNNSFTSYGLLIIGLVIVLFLFNLLKKEKSSIGQAAFIFIIGGALGNLFDRALDGVVTDFLLLFFGKISLFVFNPADLFITIGAILFIANEINVKKGSSNS
jgi:signal peptidase II